MLKATIIADCCELPMQGSTGKTADIYRYTPEIILKLFKEYMPEDKIEWEWNTVRRIRQVYDHMPAPLDLVRYKGRYGILYERINGGSMLGEITRELGGGRKCGAKMAQIHLEMHRIESNIGETVKEKLARDISAAPGLLEEEVRALLAMVEEMPDGKALCHLDFCPDNIMLPEEGDRYYVIDWMTARTGAPVLDVARTVLLLTYGEPFGFPEELLKLLRVLMLPLRRSYLKTYAKASGISPKAIRKYMLPIAAARLSERLTKQERVRLVRYVRKQLRARDAIPQK